MPSSDISHPKTNFLKKVFSEVPETYEQINHVLTLGLDILWRRQAARIAAASGGTHWADMCTGTGEMACYLSRLAASGTVIHAVDFSIPMMAKAMKKPEARNIDFVVSDVKALPFPDESLDLITISFATRNINLSSAVLTQTFAEFFRVLKPGGKLGILEFSKPNSKIIRLVFGLYFHHILPRIASLFSRSDAYRYLPESVDFFPTRHDIYQKIIYSGFQRAEIHDLTFGISTIFLGFKSDE